MTLARGTRLGPYEVLESIGAGAMGEVYRATDARLDREVAVKILPPTLAGDLRLRERFEAEARAASAVAHPNIVTIYDVGRAADISYIVMEYVDGAALRDDLHAGPLPIQRVLDLAIQIAEGLSAAHDKQIVHRDLKPENIKITGRGAVKLLDFGIAKRAVSGHPDTAATCAQLTATGQIVGTAGYMSPEQVAGQQVDHRSDQFALGLILFEMVTGRRAFEGHSHAETLAAILRDAVPSARELNPNVPPPLQWVIDRCLAKQREDRYASTHDIAKDLAALRDRLMRNPLVTAPAKSSTLPVSRTPLVGRDADALAARLLLLRDEVRLVTFTGAGGTGKTRLALQVAADVGPAFGGGVYFVALASITDAALVALTVVQALGTHQIGSRQPEDVLKETLCATEEPLLLVLDNFEQVLEASRLVTDLLESCARLKVLVTSRAVLRVYGEHDFEVPPLELPGARRRSTAELARCPAVALFVQRATAVKPDFVLTPENAPAVAEICTKLDGLPLAIELAAARVRMLKPAAILQRLESRFVLLTGGARDLPARQQTLRATVEWSHGLLTPEEQKLFRRLTGFVNGCTLESVEAVCNAPGDLGADVLDAMESLVGKSLVQRTEQPDGELRFVMLETIREYGMERLVSSEDAAVTHRAHAAYCLVLAEESADGEITPDGRARWLARCDLERDNFRAALEWATRTHEVEWGLRLGAALFPFWQAREHYGEGRERLGALLELAVGTGTRKPRARALHAAGDLAILQFDNAAARPLLEESLAVSRALQDDAGVVSGLNSLAALERYLGNWESARALFEECLEISREAGNEPAVARSLSNLAHTLRAGGDCVGAKALCEQALAMFVRLNDVAGVAWSQSHLGDLAREQGDVAAASAWYECARATFESLGDRRGVARAIADLGTLASHEGEHRRARSMLTQALTLFRDLRHRQGISLVLEGFAVSAAKRGQAERALRLAGAADAIRHALGAPLFPTDKVTLMRELDPARQALGMAASTAEMEGWLMTIESAIDYALNEDTS